MNRGIYTACAAMLLQERDLDVVTNNLANVGTAGFKRRISAAVEFAGALSSLEGNSLPVVNSFHNDIPAGDHILSYAPSRQDCLDLSAGALSVTGGSLDVAVDGVGFFAVQNLDGTVAYTRQGSFCIDGNGVLVTADGLSLQGEGGPIAVDVASEVNILSDGQVIADGEPVGQVLIYDFADPRYLRNIGGGLVSATTRSGEAAAVENVKLVPGSVELSNVSAVEEMARMIEIQRAYESASKALMTHDEATENLINTFGRA